MIEGANGEALGVYARLFSAGFTPQIHGLLGTSGHDKPDAAADDAAADHYDLFGYRVPPHAGVFLDPEGRLGGSAATYVVQTRHQAGLPAATVEPDHAASELVLLAALLESDDPVPAARFLDEHVLGWLPALVFAIREQPYAGYQAAADLLLDLLVAIRSGLPTEAQPPIPLEPVVDPIEDEAAGVNEVAQWLTTPSRSGFFVGRGEVASLGRASGSPRGFGGRRLMMGNLLRNAAHFDTLDAVVAGLDDLAERWETAWRSLGMTGAGSLPVWSAFWVGRIVRTRQSLTTLAHQVKEQSR